ncbi:hypothetical protein N7517_011509 [Penicillium concentricum]|uniref:Protein kinase domain-containing protein n=1 Tax=Penicillium concentricum TaxID=293559 RepID=A0A9W9RAY8_9EURO|nr:uncharacterized protein N7517_011509 [Penicillium concentricum]KAJ5356900.1 hypothetical protein N7517_011509 [Penicillium concentricum]
MCMYDYAQRQYENRTQHAIFGLSTDNEQFHFLRINSEGQWSRRDMNYRARHEIGETLAYIHTQASILSTREGSHGSEGHDGPKKSRSQRRTDRNLSTNDKDDSSTIDWSVFQVEENMCWSDESDEDDSASDDEYEG